MRIVEVRRAAAAAVALGLVCAVTGCGRQSTPAGILLITIDTCRADRVGAYGRPGLTPHLDRLADAGMVFEDVTAPAPLTLPSHATILTGLYPDRHGLRDNGIGRLPHEITTLAEVLQDRGWDTAAFVSAYPLERRFGLDQGFAVYDETLTGTAAAGVPDGGSEDVLRRLFYEERNAQEVADAAKSWLGRAADSDRPFFLWAHFFDPHAAYRPPERFLRRDPSDPYQGEIAFVDEQIGRILEEIDRERVIVCVTADHGESLGEHEEKTHALFVYQSSLRVPWILAGPGVPVGRHELPTSLVHVGPTLLALAGGSFPDAIDGVAVLSGRDPQPLFGESLFARIHYDWAGLRTVRDERWKLIEAPVSELYDLERDPGETVNLAESHPEVVRRLRAELANHAARPGVVDTAIGEVDEETRARLERLGYVGSSRGSVGADLWNTGGEDPKKMVGFFNRLQEVPTLMIAGRNEEAGRLLESLRRIDSRNRDVLEKLAVLRRTEERWEEAKALCEEILRLDPDDRQARFNLASAQYELGDEPGALASYREVTVRSPGEVEGWSRYGVALTRAGRPEDAVAAHAKAVELAPNDPDVRVALAAAQEEKGEVTEALAEYDHALELAPRNAGAINGKALLLSHQNRPQEAVEILRAAVSELGDDLDTLNNLAWILTNERIDADEAYRYAVRASQIAPDDPIVLDTLGWAAIRSGRPAEAVAPLTKSWQETNDAEVRAHLGIALAESGRLEEGRDHLKRAVAERSALSEIPEVAKWRK